MQMVRECLIRRYAGISIMETSRAELGQAHVKLELQMKLESKLKVEVWMGFEIWWVGGWMWLKRK